MVDLSTDRDSAFVIGSFFAFLVFDMPNQQNDGPTLKHTKEMAIMRLLSTTAPSLSKAQAARKIVFS
jgi:hypothetical protein